MAFILTKLFVTAGFIVLITEIAKRSDKFGGMIAALPLTTLLVIFWMHFEGASDNKIANHITYTLFFIAPTLPMFFLFPWLIGKFGFFAATTGSVVLTILCIYVFNVFSETIGFRIL
ncbi:MAG: hypothetical protein CMM80_03440 [Rhodospirillaceae bacterium]|nr:hypothetical protein [Rhodospirillaceae bacterium]